MSADSSKIVSLVGVYNADGTLSGELRYWLGARVGRAHCALCEITHGSFREKEEWKRQSASLPVPFEAVHLDERSPEVAAASGAQTPCVVALISAVGYELLLGPDQLEACRAEPAAPAAAFKSQAQAPGRHFAPHPRQRPPHSDAPANRGISRRCFQWLCKPPRANRFLKNRPTSRPRYRPARL